MPPYAYVAASADDALSIFDVQYANPTFVGSIQGAGAPPRGNWLNGAYSVSLKKARAHVACIFDNALTIIDVFDPTTPTFLGSIQGAGAEPWLGNAHGVFVKDDLAYVAAPADNALTIIDVSNPTNPTFVGSIRGAGAPPGGNWLQSARHVYVVGNLAYVTAMLDDALTIIDVSDPTNPTFVGSIQGAGAPPGGNWLGQALHLEVIGNYAYIAAYNDNAFTIIDVSNPAAPTFVGSIQGAGVPPGGNWLFLPMSVHIVGNLAYIPAHNDNALTIISIANPAIPAFVGSIQGAGAPPGGNWLGGACEAHVRGNLAYVTADSDNALTVINVANPAAPVFLGTIRGAGAPNYLSAPQWCAVSYAPTVQTLPATEIT